MKTHSSSSRRVTRLVIIVALLLMVPFIAMRFSGEVTWTTSDFVVAGALLLGTGLMYELAVRKSGSNTYRAAAGVALGAGLALVWLNLAVGLIGNENNPANLMYFGVLAIGLIGAIIARFQPLGMSRALVAMAIAQFLVPLIALAAGMPKSPPLTSEGPGILGIMVLNGVFAALFLGSAWLFRSAARERLPASAGPAR